MRERDRDSEVPTARKRQRERVRNRQGQRKWTKSYHLSFECKTYLWWNHRLGHQQDQFDVNLKCILILLHQQRNQSVYQMNSYFLFSFCCFRRRCCKRRQKNKKTREREREALDIGSTKNKTPSLIVLLMSLSNLFILCDDDRKHTNHVKRNDEETLKKDTREMFLLNDVGTVWIHLIEWVEEGDERWGYKPRHRSFHPHPSRQKWGRRSPLDMYVSH